MDSMFRMLGRAANLATLTLAVSGISAARSRTTRSVTGSAQTLPSRQTTDTATRGPGGCEDRSHG